MRLAVRFAVHGVIRQVQVEIAGVVEVGEHAAAGTAEDAKLRLVVEHELTAHVAEELIGLGVVGMPAEGGDVEIGPAVAVDVSPGHGMPGDFGNMRKEAGLIAGVTKRELGLGAGHCRRKTRQNPREEHLLEAAIGQHRPGSQIKHEKEEPRTLEKHENQGLSTDFADYRRFKKAAGLTQRRNDAKVYEGEVRLSERPVVCSVREFGILCGFVW